LFKLGLCSKHACIEPHSPLRGMGPDLILNQKLFVDLQLFWLWTLGLEPMSSCSGDVCTVKKKVTKIVEMSHFNLD